MARNFVVTVDDVQNNSGWLSRHVPTIFGRDNDDLALPDEAHMQVSRADFARDIIKAALADEPTEKDLRRADMWIAEGNGMGTSFLLRNLKNGIFKEMLPEDGSISPDSVEGVRMLADRISVDNSRYPVRGEAITEQNYRYVLNDIALLTGMAMTGEEYSQNFTPTADGAQQPRRKLPTVGFLDRDNQPIALKADENIVEKNYNPQLPAEHQFGVPLVKPNIFKRLINKLFGAFKAEINEYNNTLTQRRETLERRVQEYTNEYDRKSANLERCNASSKLLAQAAKEGHQMNIADRVPTNATELKRELALETGKDLNNAAAKTTAPIARNKKQNEIAMNAPEHK